MSEPRKLVNVHFFTFEKGLNYSTLSTMGKSVALMANSK